MYSPISDVESLETIIRTMDEWVDDEILEFNRYLEEIENHPLNTGKFYEPTSKDSLFRYGRDYTAWESVMFPFMELTYVKYDVPF